MKEMHWMVFPRPISSPRIPFTPFSYRDYRENKQRTDIKVILTGQV
jgi:hypothetical protein